MVKSTTTLIDLNRQDETMRVTDLSDLSETRATLVNQAKAEIQRIKSRTNSSRIVLNVIAGLLAISVAGYAVFGSTVNVMETKIYNIGTISHLCLNFDENLRITVF